MKLISLNIWGGRIHKPLLEFIDSWKKDIDIFCFQEVFKSEKNFFSHGIKTDIFSDIKTLLKDYDAYYAPTFNGNDLEERVDYEIFFGQATYIKNSIKILEEGSVFVYGSYNHEYTLLDEIERKSDYRDFPRLLHYVVLEENKKNKLIANIHGFWVPQSKLDTPERLEQSDKIMKFLDSKKMQKILCGDFNLNPNTQSMIKLEKNMINLIKKYGIRNTRSNLYTRKDKFADYVLVSPDVSVNEFKLIHEDVSDHLPLYLDFS